MSDISYRFISDPGHGWLEVGWTALKALGLNPSDFSRYSYRKGNTFYLEEDCDAAKFVAAWQAKFGHEPATRSVHLDPCFVRDLPHIHE